MNRPIKFNPAGIPTDLKTLPRFIAWAYGQPDPKRGGKRPKAPANGAKTNDPKTWRTFTAAAAAEVKREANVFDAGGGVGLVLTGLDDLLVIDVDHCRNPEMGELNELAEKVLDLAPDTFAEVSPSGTGIHVFVRVTPGEWLGTRIDTSRGLDILYGGDGKGRYVALTGVQCSVLGTDTVAQASPELMAWLHEQFPEKAAPAPADQPQETRKAAKLLPDEGVPDWRELKGLSPAAVALLTDGTLPDSGDRSGAVHSAALALMRAGLDDAQTLTVLFNNEHVYWYVADKRQRSGADQGAAVLAFLKDHSIAPAWERVQKDRAAPQAAAEQFEVLPPLTPAEQAEDEAARAATFARGYRRDARDGTATTHPLNELGNARRLIDKHGDTLRYHQQRGEWLRWAGGRWTVVDDGVVIELALKLSEGIYAEGVGHGRDNADHFAAWANKSGSTKTATETVKALAALSEVRTAQALDANPWLCGLDEGRKVLDLHTGGVRPARKADFITKALAVATVGESSKAVRWLQFLDEVTCGDKALAGWIQKFLGYCLTGSIEEHVYAFAQGTGRNGKGVLTELMLRLMGAYGAPLSMATLTDTKRSAAGASSDLAALDGVRFVVAPEASERQPFNEDFLKSLVAGDSQSVREVFEKQRRLIPCMKLFIVGNERPLIRDRTGALWERTRLIPFKATFRDADKSAPGEPIKDPKLMEKLQAELPHILAHLVEGCQRWQTEGLNTGTPRAVLLATEEYRDESDHLGRWLDERCEQGARHDEKASVLYQDFVQWSHDEGNRPPSSVSFGKQLSSYTRHGWAIGSDGRRDGKYRLGIRLKWPDAEDRQNVIPLQASR